MTVPSTSVAPPTTAEPSPWVAVPMDSGILLLAAALLICAGGWLLVWAGRVRRRRQAW